MRHFLVVAVALAVLLPPAAVARAADPPSEGPLKQHEVAMRDVLDSWNDIATALSLIRDASGAQKFESVVRDSLLKASKVGKQMNQLRSPTRQEDRELCKRVLGRAREVRARIKTESDRVSRIPGLTPEVKSLLGSVALVGAALDKIIAKGGSSPPPEPTLPPEKAEK